MSEVEDSLTILLPGVGLVDCTTRTAHDPDGSVLYIRVESAVDQKSKHLDGRARRQIERILHDHNVSVR